MSLSKIQRLVGAAVTSILCAHGASAAPIEPPPPYPAPLGKPVTWIGESDAYNQIQVLDKSIVEKWLPSSLELVPVPGFDGKHPIVMVFQEQGEAKANGEAVAGYLEQAIIIPSVRIIGQQTVRSFMPKLYLNAQEPIDIGRTAWGLAKYAGIFELAGGDWKVTDAETQQHVLSASFVPQGQLANFQTFVSPGQYPDFLSDLGLFGSDYVGFSQSGPVCFELVYDFEKTLFQSVAADVTVKTPYLPSMEIGSKYTAGVVNGNPEDSFRVKGPYTLSPAHSCWELK